MSLASVFLRHVGGSRERLAARPDLEATLAALVQTAREAWPQVSLPTETFLRHVAERLPADGDPVAALGELHAPDLFLACACTHGDRQALAAFEDRFLSSVSAYLSRADALPGFTDDVKQALRTRLLVADGDVVPRIASYGGRGPLAGWLRMTAARVAVDLRRQQKPDRPLDAQHDEIQASAADPELQYMKTHYRHELEEAFRATLAGLAARDANVMRLHFLDGMTFEAIGALHRVSARTAQRWLADARARILAETRRLLAERLHLSSTQLDALIGLVQSQIDVSVRRFLRKRRGPARS